jgi:hypothetical protein
MNLQNLLPQFFPSSWEKDSEVYGITFTPDVSLGFVEREKGGYSYLLTGDEDVVPELLFENSLDNLKKQSVGVEVKIGYPPGATVLWVNAPDNFAAVRLLLPSVMELIKEKIGNRFFFTIPSRDLILCWNVDAPKSLTDKHTREALEDFESEEYSLSPYVYEYSDTWPCKRVR